MGLGCIVSNIRIRFYELEDARMWKGLNELRQIDLRGNGNQKELAVCNRTTISPFTLKYFN